MTKFLVLSACALFLAFAPAGAQSPPAESPRAESPPAASACGPYDELAAHLGTRFGEALRFRGDDERGLVLEVFVSPDGGWTVLMRRGDRACAVAGGTDWRDPGDPVTRPGTPL